MCWCCGLCFRHNYNSWDKYKFLYSFDEFHYFLCSGLKTAIFPDPEDSSGENVRCILASYVCCCPCFLAWSPFHALFYLASVCCPASNQRHVPTWMDCMRFSLAPTRRLLLRRRVATMEQLSICEFRDPQYLNLQNSCCLVGGMSLGYSLCNSVGNNCLTIVSESAVCLGLAMSPLIVPAITTADFLNRTCFFCLIPPLHRAILNQDQDGFLRLAEDVQATRTRLRAFDLPLHMLFSNDSVLLTSENVKLLILANPSALLEPNFEQLVPLQLALRSNAPVDVLEALIEVPPSLTLPLKSQYIFNSYLYGLQYKCIDIVLHQKESSDEQRIEARRQEDDVRRYSALILADLPLQGRSGGTWFNFLSSDIWDLDVATDVVTNAFTKYPLNHFDLAYSKDDRGRLAIDIANGSLRQVMQRFIFFCARYEILDGAQPIHRSATSVVYFALDHDLSPPPHSRDSSSGSGNKKARGKFKYKDPTEHLVVPTPSDPSQKPTVKPPTKVAIKLMQNADQFEREKNARSVGKLNDEFVLGILREHYDGHFDGDFKRELSRFNLTSYPYALVMPAATKNLKALIDSERIAGRDWDAIRSIGIQICKAAHHMHECGRIHGDIKPLNIVSVDERVVLIDLDASVQWSPAPAEWAGAKWSSAYLPPEMIFQAPNGELFVRESSVAASLTMRAKGLEVDLVPAHPNLDIWAIGCVLFQLCSGETLWQANDEDNLDQRSLSLLHDWGRGWDVIGDADTAAEQGFGHRSLPSLQPLELFSSTDFRLRKLAKIRNPLARNLVSQMLSAAPANRICGLAQALVHPFFTGHIEGRAAGEAAQFDVFLSFRIDADSALASLFYDSLCAAGLRVYCPSLNAANKGDGGFLRSGLMSCKAFVPICSRAAMKNRFEDLRPASASDSILLEHRLALELYERRIVNRIYPILVGDFDSVTQSYGKYFHQGCQPQLTSPVIVAALESRVRAHLERVGLGLPLKDGMTVADVFAGITINQGGFVVGALSDLAANIQNTCAIIKGMCDSC